MTEFVKSKIAFWFKGLFKNESLTVKGFIGGFIAMSFPYKHEYLVIVTLSVLFTIMIVIVGNALKKIGSYQSMIAFSLSIVGLILMHVNLTIEWIFILLICSLITVSGEFLLNQRAINHNCLLMDYDNIVYYSMIGFGLFKIWSSASGFSKVVFV